MSYTEGDDVELRVHTSERHFSVRFGRDGYDPELVFERQDARGIPQRSPDDAAIKGCGWNPALSVSTAKWKPGLYIVYLGARSPAGREARGEPDRWNDEVLPNSRMEPPGASRPLIEPGADFAAGTLGAGIIVYFERGQGSVSNARICSWVRGLEADDHYTVQITKNVLNRFNN